MADSIKFLSTEEFIEALRKQRNKGMAYIPLIGAGLSAPSGNPVLTELGLYLVRCICRALGIDNPNAWNPTKRKGEFDLRSYYRWLPGRDDWPPYGDPQIYARDTENWKQRLADYFAELSRRCDGGNEQGTDELSVVQEAVGASSEWRSSLLFLSRLVAFEVGNNRELIQLRLGPPNRDIVDTFVLTVMMGRPPTLGHHMLAMLAGPLRISLALTTNFDDLLEQAFSASNNPCTVFDVHIDSGLPSYRDVAGLNAIVKLHGGRYGMRADYSLDTPPTDTDLRHFVSYLAGCPIDEDKWGGLRHRLRTPHGPNSTSLPGIPAQRHLIVVGIGAKDARINQMIRAAANVLEDMHVFWVCYFDREVDTTAKLLADLGVPRENQHITRERFPGLLLLHAYQELAGALPPTHVVFPSAHRVSTPPIWQAHLPDLSNAPELPIIQQSVEACTNMEPHTGADGQLSQPRTRCVIVHGPPGTKHGGMSLAAAVFDHQLNSKHQAVWIDLDEIGSVYDLFETLIQTVARKSGITDWMPVVLRSSDHELVGKNPLAASDAQIQELARITNSPNRKWIIFINARSGPTINLHSGQATGEEVSYNGWLDITKRDTSASTSPDDDSSATGLMLVDLLKRIGGEECPNVSVVLTCYEGPFVNLCVPLFKPFPYLVPLEKAAPFSPDPVQEALKWIHEGIDERPRRVRFLMALCLANRARFLAMLWQWPFHETTNVSLDERKNTTRGFLRDLEASKVIRRKNGGFVWMLCRTRDELRRLLPDELKATPMESACTAADIHHGLAEWYHRVFRATEDPSASFEIVYHRCRQVQDLLDQFTPRHSKKALALVTAKIRDALGDASLALDRGRPCMLALGFSKGLCRRLHQLRLQLLHDVVTPLERIKALPRSPDKEYASRLSKFIKNIQAAIAILQDQSLALNRDIAIEVGENLTALQRQLQLRDQQYSRTLTNTSPAGVAHYRSNTPAGKRYLKRMLSPRRGENKADWMRSTIDLATLGIAARSYTYAENQLLHIFTFLRLDKRLYKGTTSVNKLDNLIRAWLQNFNVDKDRDVLQQMIIALRRYQQLVLAREMARTTCCERASRTTHETVDWDYHSASRCYETAIRIFRWLAGTRKSHTQSDYALNEFDLKLDRVWHRLVVHHALTLGYQQDFTQAHARLNDAEALLNVSGVAADALERGVIELIRAEVITQQVLYKEDVPWEYNCFGELRKNILAKLSNADLTRGLKPTLDSQKDLLKNACAVNVDDDSSDDPLKTLRKAKSCIADAWQACSRAERSLKRFRKNVWWTTWFFELQIKLAELEIFLALNSQIMQDKATREEEEGAAVHQLPHLGPESAAFAVPTRIERLLDNAERMVRLDLYRIARIIESFANSVQATLLWKERLPRESRIRVFLGIRLEYLCRRLREAEKSLRIRLNRRVAEDAASPKTRLDDSVLNYVEFVLDHCDRVCQCVSIAFDPQNSNANEIR